MAVGGLDLSIDRKKYCIKRARWVLEEDCPTCMSCVLDTISEMADRWKMDIDTIMDKLTFIADQKYDGITLRQTVDHLISAIRTVELTFDKVRNSMWVKGERESSPIKIGGEELRRDLPAGGRAEAERCIQRLKELGRTNVTLDFFALHLLGKPFKWLPAEEKEQVKLSIKYLTAPSVNKMRSASTDGSTFEIV
nr:hypothetical protein [Candidatus Njordarchaeota archaeon]